MVREERRKKSTEEREMSGLGGHDWVEGEKKRGLCEFTKMPHLSLFLLFLFQAA